MGDRRTSHGSDPSEPVLSGPDQAARVVRLSAPPAQGPAVVVLLLDARHRLLLTITVDGAPPAGAARAVDLVLAIAQPAGVAGVVVGIVRERLGQYLPKGDAAALAGMAERCAAAGVDLLDVLLVGPRGWRSVRHLAAQAREGDDGGQ